MDSHGSPSKTETVKNGEQRESSGGLADSASVVSLVLSGRRTCRFEYCSNPHFANVSEAKAIRQAIRATLFLLSYSFRAPSHIHQINSRTVVSLVAIVLELPLGVNDRRYRTVPPATAFGP
jgi:hypothetical protein